VCLADPARQACVGHPLASIDLTVFENPQSGASATTPTSEDFPAGAETLIDSIVAGFAMS